MIPTIQLQIVTLMAELTEALAGCKEAEDYDYFTETLPKVIAKALKDLNTVSISVEEVRKLLEKVEKLNASRLGN